jgi:hypothetical protein
MSRWTTLTADEIAAKSAANRAARKNPAKRKAETPAGVPAKPPRSKYRNTIVEVDGIKWKSAKQARRYQELKMLDNAGKISNLCWEVTHRIMVNGIGITSYRVDFEYLDGDGNGVMEDVKPTFRSEKSEKAYKQTGAYKMFSIKKRLMAALYGIDVKEV